MKTLECRLRKEKDRERFQLDMVITLNIQVDVADWDLLHVRAWLAGYKHHNDRGGVGR